MHHNTDAEFHKNESQIWCKKGHLPLFVSKERKRMHQKDDVMNSRSTSEKWCRLWWISMVSPSFFFKRSRKESKMWCKIPFFLKEKVNQEEIDIKKNQNSDAILVSWKKDCCHHLHQHHKSESQTAAEADESFSGPCLF